MSLLAGTCGRLSISLAGGWFTATATSAGGRSSGGFHQAFDSAGGESFSATVKLLHAASGPAHKPAITLSSHARRSIHDLALTSKPQAPNPLPGEKHGAEGRDDSQRRDCSQGLKYLTSPAA